RERRFRGPANLMVSFGTVWLNSRKMAAGGTHGTRGAWRLGLWWDTFPQPGEGLLQPRQGRSFSDPGRTGPGRWERAGQAQSLYPASTPEVGESPRLPSPAGIGAHGDTKVPPSVSSQRANTRSRCSSESNDARYSSARRSDSLPANRRVRSCSA